MFFHFAIILLAITCNIYLALSTSVISVSEAIWPSSDGSEAPSNAGSKTANSAEPDHPTQPAVPAGFVLGTTSLDDAPEKNDPEKAAKQWQQAKTLVKASRETAIMSADETRKRILPLLRAICY